MRYDHKKICVSRRFIPVRPPPEDPTYVHDVLAPATKRLVEAAEMLIEALAGRAEARARRVPRSPTRGEPAPARGERCPTRLPGRLRPA